MIYFIHRKTGQAGWLGHYFYLLNLSGFVMDTEGECETQKKYQCKELPPSSCLRWDTTSNRKRGGSHLKQEEGRIPPQTGRGEDPTSNRKILPSFFSGGILPSFCLRWAPPLFLFVVGSSSLPVCGGLLPSSCLWWAYFSPLPVCGGLLPSLSLRFVQTS
jgi:hypothetical protein